MDVLFYLSYLLFNTWFWYLDCSCTMMNFISPGRLLLNMLVLISLLNSLCKHCGLNTVSKYTCFFRPNVLVYFKDKFFLKSLNFISWIFSGYSISVLMLSSCSPGLALTYAFYSMLVHLLWIICVKHRVYTSANRNHR